MSQFSLLARRVLSAQNGATIQRRIQRHALIPLASLTAVALSAVFVTPDTSIRAQQRKGEWNGSLSRESYSAQRPDPLTEGRQLIEVPVHARQPSTLNVAYTPMEAFGSTDHQDAARGPQPACPPVIVKHTDGNFEGGSYIMQAGFVANEMAAVSFTIPAAEFPIIVRGSEMIFAQQNATVQTTTHWSWIVWEGTPDTGTIVATFSSDDVILPHLVMPPGTRGTNVQVLVDPMDPDQVVVQNNGSATFTVGYRIDAHNNPPTQPCNFNITPAACCPPLTNSNAFPTVDTSGVASTANNWLYCLPNCGFGACPGGWHRFSGLGAFRPSGDWMIRATYEPFTCDIPFGACCFLDGSGICTNQFDTNCVNAGGTFMGDDTSCATIACPPAVGACCIQSGPTTQCNIHTEASCQALNVGSTRAVWLGAGTTCAGGACNDAGACCFPASCANLSALNCQAAGGEFNGIDSACATTICNPFGACCLPDGSCSAMSDDDCATASGAFQGHDVLCSSVNCPQPQGACCLNGGGCFSEEQSNCEAIPGAVWAGAGTECKTDCSPPTTGACCLSSGGCIIDEQANCAKIPGAAFAGVGTVCPDDCEPDCPADLSGDDDTIDVFDLFVLLSNWNTNGSGAELADPMNLVDVFDLFVLLGAWGDCD